MARQQVRPGSRAPGRRLSVERSRAAGDTPSRGWAEVTAFAVGTGVPPGESSKQEHHTVYDQYISDACGAQYKGCCQRRNKHVKRVYSQTRSAAAINQTRGGSLSRPRRRQLDIVVFTIHEHTASMTEALCRAASSQFIDPAFIKKLTEVKEDLEAAGGAVCLLYTSPSPRDLSTSRMPSSA